MVGAPEQCIDGEVAHNTSTYERINSYFLYVCVVDGMVLHSQCRQQEFVCGTTTTIQRRSDDCKYATVPLTLM